MSSRREVAIVGAGPYGLSIAAHLRVARVGFRIFGSPMHTWRERMPDGMILKSDGFASNLSDPESAFTLRHFCETLGVAYDDTRVPVHLETMRAYGLAFQQRMVPELEDTQVVGVERDADGFRLDLSNGRTAVARNVVVAVGISHFQHVPPILMDLPGERLSHSSTHKSVEGFCGREVTVIGAGASAIDVAVLLRDAGANVVLVGRRSSLRFNDPPPVVGRRSFWARLRSPSSPIGPGWKSRFYSDAPGLFHHLPEATRWRLVSKSLSPAAGWPMKERFLGRVSVLLGYDIEQADVRDDRVRLLLTGRSGEREHVTDHVIAATGYRVDLRRLTFLSPEILSTIRMVHQAPVLASDLESSVSGLFFVGIAAKYCFGPVMQFACGADWAARRIAGRLAKAGSRKGVPLVAGATA